jgi:ketosteroid isomerase-like protein
MYGGAERPVQMTGGEIRRRIVDITRLRLAGDLDRLMEYFCPDVVVHYNCTKEGLFTPGVLNGREEFRANLRLTEENYQGVDGEIVDILVENDLSAVRWRTQWRHRGVGLVYPLEMAYFLRWRGNFVVEMHEFLDIPGAATLGRGGLGGIGDFEDMFNPRPPGLSREAIASRMHELADFPTPMGMDLAATRKYFSPDVICEFIGNRTRFPYAGRHVGVEALTNIVRTISTEFEQFNCGLSDLLIDGGRAACRRTVEVRHRGTGRHGLVELAEFLKFENGLIVEMIEYRDSVTILEIQGEMEGR